MAKRPTEAELQSLVEAYARKINCDASSVKTQQRIHDVFTRIHERLQRKYPHINMTSDAVFAEMQARAKAWWQSRPFRGSGIDW